MDRAMETSFSCDCNTCGGDAQCHYRSVDFELNVKYDGEQTLNVTSLDLVRENPAFAKDRAVDTKVSDPSEQRLSRSALTVSKGFDPLPFTRCCKIILRSRFRFIIRRGQIQMVHGLDPAQGALEKKQSMNMMPCLHAEVVHLIVKHAIFCRGRREGTRDMVGFGPVVFHNDSVGAIKDVGLHDAELPPLTMGWAKSCRSGMDLSYLTNFREHSIPRTQISEPRQQIDGIAHRPSGGETNLDMQREERSNKRLDLEDNLQPEHLVISSDTVSGRLGTQRKPSFQVTTTHFQIFIKTPEGKSCLVWVHVGSTIMQLKQQIWALTGYPVQTQHLVRGRWSLQDSRSLGSYEISTEESIVLNLRLRGGAKPQGQPSFSGGDKGKKTAPQHQPKGIPSYKNILQGNRDSGSSPDQGGYIPSPYIVDQLGQTPALNFDSSGIDDFVKDYETQALICRFNSFWPKPTDLFHWIFNSWTMECDIHLCSKGFFIVRFASREVRDTIISAGPWFWGTSGLFMTPWFPDFNPNNMTVSKVPVWVRLYNLPLHFWSEQVLEGIGNNIGKYIKTDLERIDERVYTFARICVEVDLSKGLPDNISLIYKQQNWLQVLDYENTTFRCRLCRQTGHLQSTCPEAKKVNGKRKQKGKQRKGWQFSPPNSEDEASKAEEEDTPVENAESSQGMETQKGTNDNEVSQIHPNQVEKANEDQSMGGIKRHHQSDTSDSDKEAGSQKAETQLVIASIEPTQGAWRKVEKKKGRKT